MIDLALERFGGLDARVFAVQRAAQELEHLFGSSEPTLKARRSLPRGVSISTRRYMRSTRPRGGALVTGVQVEIRFGRGTLHTRYVEAVTALILAVSDSLQAKMRDPEFRPD